MKKIENIKIKPLESLNDFDEIFNSIIIELAALEKSNTNREVALKIMKVFPREWDVKTMT